MYIYMHYIYIIHVINIYVCINIHKYALYLMYDYKRNNLMKMIAEERKIRKGKKFNETDI